MIKESKIFIKSLCYLFIIIKSQLRINMRYLIQNLEMKINFWRIDILYFDLISFI